jgi:hypothetical protein
MVNVVRMYGETKVNSLEEVFQEEIATRQNYRQLGLNKDCLYTQKGATDPPLIELTYLVDWTANTPYDAAHYNEREYD